MKKWICLVVLLWVAVSPLKASYAFYVGKDLTADGSVLIGGTGEEVSSHWLEIVPRRRHPKGSTIQVGVTKEANIPGELIEISQAPMTYKYITMNYTDFKGFPPPLTNGGLNENQVAVRDVWSPSRKELVAMTPTPQKGLQYSDLARIAVERATTAREAVEIMGTLIDKYGYATYGGNSHMVADPNEGWVMIQFAGGKGLWVAERLRSDEVRVSYPGYIGEIPQDYQKHPDYMGSKNLISFAVEQGWFDPGSGKPFNVHDVYGKQGTKAGTGLKYVDALELEKELIKLAPNITIADFMAFIRDPRICDEEAGYGQVAHLRAGIRPELAVLWVAPIGSVASPFVPYWMGVRDTLPEYKQHRYLTKKAGQTFLNPDYQAQEATMFAGRLYKRLLYYACENTEKFLPEITEALQAFEKSMLEEQSNVEETAEILLASPHPELAHRYLTFYTQTKAKESLDLGKALLESIEARTKLLYGIRPPRTKNMNSQGGTTPNCLMGHDPDQKSWDKDK